MSRLDGVFDDFAHHVTGGGTQFITAAYEAAERSRTQAVLVKLLPLVEVPDAVAQDAPFVARVTGLRDKFLDILRAQSRIAPGDVATLMVGVDFGWDPAAAEQRRQELEAVPVYYGHDPVYRCSIFLKLVSGEERTANFRDRGMS